MLLSQLHSASSETAVRTPSVVPLTKYLMTTSYFHHHIDECADRWLAAFEIRPDASFYYSVLQRFRSLIIDELTAQHQRDERESLDLHMAVRHATQSVLGRWLHSIFPERCAEDDLKQGFAAIRLAFLLTPSSFEWQELFLSHDLPENFSSILHRHFMVATPSLMPVTMIRQEI
jgi:hypothetical protein